MAKESSNSLVEAAQAGDTKAFAALVECHYGMVRALAYSKVDDWTAAEDIAQDVFLVAWSNLTRLRHPEAFLMWLRRIARNAASNWVRKSAYRRQLAERNVEQRRAITAEEDDPAANAAREECLDQIGDALDHLSPKLREAMILFYIEGKTVAESAQELGIRVDTLKKRLRHGRQRMQQYYQRNASYDLEQLLPHKPKRQIDNIMAGLALGPVLPDFGATVSKAGLSLWLHDLLHGASPSLWKGTGLKIAGIPIAAVPSVAVATVVTLLALGAGGVLVFEPGEHALGASVAAVPPEEVPPDTHYANSAAALVSDAPGAGVERYLIVENLFADATLSGSGLRKGDRIIEVNNLPLSASLLEDPRAYFFGLPGTSVHLTVMRPNEDRAGEFELEFDLLRPYFPKQYEGDDY